MIHFHFASSETLWNGMFGIKNFILSYWETAVASANLNNEVREPEYDTSKIEIDASAVSKYYSRKKKIATKTFTADIVKGDYYFAVYLDAICICLKGLFFILCRGLFRCPF